MWRQSAYIQRVSTHCPPRDPFSIFEGAPPPATAPLSLNSVLPVTIVSCIEGLAPWLGMLFGQVPEAYEVGPSCRKQVTGAISCLAALPVPLSVSVAQSVSSPHVPPPSATLR